MWEMVQALWESEFIRLLVALFIGAIIVAFVADQRG